MPMTRTFRPDLRRQRFENGVWLPPLAKRSFEGGQRFSPVLHLVLRYGYSGPGLRYIGRTTARRKKQGR